MIKKTEKSQRETSPIVQRQKNPKRVAAGKKGAEARKAKGSAKKQLNVEPHVSEGVEQPFIEDGIKPIVDDADTNIFKEQLATKVTKDTD